MRMAVYETREKAEPSRVEVLRVTGDNGHSKMEVRYRAKPEWARVALKQV